MSLARKAVVIGGGFAGLIAARILAEHFESVVVIEKDTKLGSDQPRTGAPQGAHLHVLLKRGQEILGSFFPGIESVFKENNCPQIDWAADTLWETRDGAFPRYPSDIQTYSFSRPFLESTVYEQLARFPSITFVNGHATRLKYNGSKVCGVFLAKDEVVTAGTDTETEQGTLIEGDFFVLAGGQNFPIDRWLLQAGLKVKNDVSPTSVTYYSVFVETDSVDLGESRQYYYQADPSSERLGSVICPVEQGRSVATLIEYDVLPRGRESFEDLVHKAAMVPGRKLETALKMAKILSPVSCFHKPTMYLRRFDRLNRCPQNLIALGDTLCSLNPVFGQGMTAALMQAEVLHKLLSKRGAEAFHSLAFHRQSVRRLQTPYLMSKLGSSREIDLSRRYLDAYVAKSRLSQRYHERFLTTLHLEKSLGSLLDPWIFLAALSRNTPTQNPQRSQL